MQKETFWIEIQNSPFAQLLVFTELLQQYKGRTISHLNYLLLVFIFGAIIRIKEGKKNTFPIIFCVDIKLSITWKTLCVF